MTDSDDHETVEQPGAARAARSTSLPLLRALRAVVLGVKDTARDMAAAGREEARRAEDEAWQRYTDLTKHRRSR